MRGFNRAIVMGNLTRDPEIRYTASQQAVANFSVAVNRTWKDRNGELREDVDFIPVVVWGKQAETCERFLRKGSGILVEGRISVRSYETKTGERRYATEIVADNFTFVGGRPDGDQSAGSYGDRGGYRNDNNGYSGNGGYNNGGNNYGGNRNDNAGFGNRPEGPAPRSYRNAAPAGNDSFPMDISELDAGAPAMGPSDDEADIPF